MTQLTTDQVLKILSWTIGMAIAAEVASADDLRDGIARRTDRACGEDGRSVHFPTHDLAAAAVLEKEIGVAVAVKVVAADKLPAGITWVANHAAGDDRGAVELPAFYLTGAGVLA